MKRFEARYDLRNENSHQTFMVRFPSTSEDTIGALIALISASQGRCECDECQARRAVEREAEGEAEMEGAAASDEDSDASNEKESPHYFLSEADRDALAEIAAKHRAKKERKKIKKAKERNQRNQRKSQE